MGKKSDNIEWIEETGGGEFAQDWKIVKLPYAMVTSILDSTINIFKHTANIGFLQESKYFKSELLKIVLSSSKSHFLPLLYLNILTNLS